MPQPTEEKIPKNIIVCADGTGNKGGYTPDSNVYKIYKAIDKHFNGKCPDGVTVRKQIIHYDNGVGTSKNKFLRALGGAIGLGFGQNVRDLYEFLARNYNHANGDRIFFFGFSRGASTVRACNGFIDKCGLIRGKDLRNNELKKLVDEAFEAYKNYDNDKKPEMKNKAPELKSSDKTHGGVNIHFMGIWDTVVALGFPKRTDITDRLSKLVDKIFEWAEDILDSWWPHSFYYYRLTDNINFAYQALAIDDERTAFWPFVWREKKKDGEIVVKKEIEQVWFSGMHSNVGGGYGRTGLASIPLHWMMVRAENCGLKFLDGSVKKAYEDSHAQGRIYNSRDGVGVFYRYHPREVEKLCDGRLLGDIKLHHSAIERLEERTANYAPGHIPGRFEVVKSELDAISEVRDPKGKFTEKWEEIREKINKLVLSRKRLYASMISYVLAILGAAIYFWKVPPSEDRHGIWGDIADILDYFLFEFLDGLINFTVAQNCYLFLSIILIFLIYLRKRGILHEATVEACEELRHLVICEKKECKDIKEKDKS